MQGHMTFKNHRILLVPFYSPFFELISCAFLPLFVEPKIDFVLNSYNVLYHASTLKRKTSIDNLLKQVRLLNIFETLSYAVCS